MTIKKEKIQNYQNKLSHLFVEDTIKLNNDIAEKDRIKSVEIARNYYTYLENNGEKYGSAALQVVNDQGMFGKVANIHLRTQAVFEGHEKSKLTELSDRIKISLAYADMQGRASLIQEFDYDKISKYHKQVFKQEGLSNYAWGGLAVEELLGSGKWMILHDANERAFQEIIGNLSSALKNNTQYSALRMVDSITHSMKCYASGESDYLPVVNGQTAQGVANLYDIDIQRVKLVFDGMSTAGYNTFDLFPTNKFKLLPENKSSSRTESSDDLPKVEEQEFTSNSYNNPYKQGSPEYLNQLYQNLIPSEQVMKETNKSLHNFFQNAQAPMLPSCMPEAQRESIRKSYNDLKNKGGNPNMDFFNGMANRDNPESNFNEFFTNLFSNNQYQPQTQFNNVSNIVNQSIQLFANFSLNNNPAQNPNLSSSHSLPVEVIGSPSRDLPEAILSELEHLD